MAPSEDCSPPITQADLIMLQHFPIITANECLTNTLPQEQAINAKRLAAKESDP